MPTCLTVRRHFVVPALLEIEDQDFAHWYSLGMYWSMFGEPEVHGPLPDTYLIHNLSSGIAQGWYNDRKSGWFAMAGFKLGMVHGGWLSCPTDTLVVLTDPDFTNGYYVGRELGWQGDSIIVKIENKRKDGKWRAASGTLRID